MSRQQEFLRSNPCFHLQMHYFCNWNLLLLDLLMLTDEANISSQHLQMREFLDCVTELMPWETLIDCYSDCTNHSVVLPWHFVPHLVTRRMVNYRRSSVPCELCSISLEGWLVAHVPSWSNHSAGDIAQGRCSGGSGQATRHFEINFRQIAGDWNEDSAEESCLCC